MQENNITGLDSSCTITAAASTLLSMQLSQIQQILQLPPVTEVIQNYIEILHSPGHVVVGRVGILVVWVISATDTIW